MTTLLSLFLDTTVPIEDARIILGQVVGRELETKRPDVGLIYQTKILDIEMRFFDNHGLDDDSGITFSRYAHQLKLIPFESGNRTKGFGQMYESIAFFLGARLADSLDCRVIVVANLQRQLAQFPDSSYTEHD